MRIHIIAVGGRIMHTLALLLNDDGHLVSGSDDEIYEPSRSKLDAVGLLPKSVGWDVARVVEDIDLVILGMHARADNPELIRAQELGIKVLSYPEFILNQSKEKQRVVIAGSHGKTTTTAMIMHVLKYRDRPFDYLIGAELDGFESMIKLSNAPLMIIEGDEYLSSSIDRRPKMHHYQPNMTVITGVSWDHVNVFKTEAEYNELFQDFIKMHDQDAPIFIYEEDTSLRDICVNFGDGKTIILYKALEKLENGNVEYDNKQYRIRVFGKHNRANMMAALQVCLKLGISAADFFAAISTFKGAAKRLELMYRDEDTVVYRDFAHAPSKVAATVTALKEHFPEKRILAFLELHTYSSLNSDFLPKYKNSLEASSEAYVYYSAHTLSVKNMPILKTNSIIDAFNYRDLVVISEKHELEAILKGLEVKNSVLVFMSSGNFDKIDVKGIFINQK